MGALEVAASALFDEEWYAAQLGRSFASRQEAAEHYSAHAGDLDASPHPLFEEAWLYPGGRWRETAPDPLSHFLARGDRASLATHPLLPERAEELVAGLTEDSRLPKTTGPRLRWSELRKAAFAALGGVPPRIHAPRRVTVVVSLAPGIRPAARWLRRLYRAHVRDDDSIELVVTPSTPSEHRLCALLALSLPGTRLAGSDDPVGAITVRVDDTSLDPPEWPWLQHLVARLDDPAVGRVGPLHVEPDQTVVAAAALPGPFLRGETPADVGRMAHLPVPDLWPGVVAFRTADGPRDPAYVVPDARIVSTGLDHRWSSAVETTHVDLWHAAGFEGPGRPLRVVEGRPALRWAIDIAAPLAPRGRRWGDDPFARSLAVALERLGQRVTVDHPETRQRASRDHDDVVLVLRGLAPVQPVQRMFPDAVVPARLLWVISHPAEVTEEECAAYDVVLAASEPWAADRARAWGREVRPLLQCTDAGRFRPGLAEPDSGPEVLFVGNSRGTDRPVVSGALEAGLPLTLYGDGWEPPVRVAGRHVPNDELGALYASAGVVLSDHWADMRELGFVSNRTFDVLASAGRLYSDDVPGLRELLAALGTSAPVWSTAADLGLLARPGWRDEWPAHADRVAAAERVVAQHSFDARARTLLDVALKVVPPSS